MRLPSVGTRNRPLALLLDVDTRCCPGIHVLPPCPTVVCYTSTVWQSGVITVSRRGLYTRTNQAVGERGMSLSILRTIFHRHAKPSDPSLATGLCAMLVAGDSPSLR